MKYHINDEGEISLVREPKSNEYINDEGEVRVSSFKPDDDNDEFPIFGTINNLYSGL
jgi:hypothetical protein